MGPVVGKVQPVACQTTTAAGRGAHCPLNGQDDAGTAMVLIVSCVISIETTLCNWADGGPVRVNWKGQGHSPGPSCFTGSGVTAWPCCYGHLWPSTHRLPGCCDPVAGRGSHRGRHPRLCRPGGPTRSGRPGHQPEGRQPVNVPGRHQVRVLPIAGNTHKARGHSHPRDSGRAKHPCQVHHQGLVRFGQPSPSFPTAGRPPVRAGHHLVLPAQAVSSSSP